MPAAEIDVTAELVAKLIGAQHPGFAGLPLTLVANGWDNVVYRLGDDLCVRLPRREAAVSLIVHELRWLPLLAQQIPFPIPVPVAAGEPGQGYPWPWSVCRWIPGQVALAVPPSQRRVLAEDLAAFFAALHTPAPADAPRSPVRGVALSERDPVVRDRLEAGIIADSPALLALWDRLVVTPPWPGPPSWVHGDPHPGNVVIGESGLAGVLDFGDLNAGDPATDLAAAWFVFDARGREVFQHRLAHIDTDTWARARGWALNIGTAVAAHTDDNPVMAEVGRHVLAQVLS